MLENARHHEKTFRRAPQLSNPGLELNRVVKSALAPEISSVNIISIERDPFLRPRWSSRFANVDAAKRAVRRKIPFDGREVELLPVMPTISSVFVCKNLPWETAIVQAKCSISNVFPTEQIRLRCMQKKDPVGAKQSFEKHLSQCSHSPQIYSGSHF